MATSLRFVRNILLKCLIFFFKSKTNDIGEGSIKGARYKNGQ